MLPATASALPSATTATPCTGPQLPVAPCSKADQSKRIQSVFGLAGSLPRVDEDSSAQYFTYLSANLSLPMTAYYPPPKNPQERIEFRCTVVELLDPAKDIYDEFDGLYCKVRKGRFEINLPLMELELTDDDRNAQLIDDYRYWFWNWR